MRVRWASSSQMTIGPSNVNDPSRPMPITRATAAQKKLTKHTRPLGRMRSSSRLLTLQSVDNAKRVSVKKEQAHATKKQKSGDGYSYVYVGNIDPIISTKDLEAFFKPCGPVACIQVRCSRGQAITRNMPVPSEVRTSRDRQYATVEFSDSKAVQKAIKKNGSRLKGCRLVVSVSAADLPEVKDILRLREAQRLGLPNPYNVVAGPSPRRPIVVEPTEEAIVAPSSDRHRFMGVSFAKCIA